MWRTKPAPQECAGHLLGPLHRLNLIWAVPKQNTKGALYLIEICYISFYLQHWFLCVSSTENTTRSRSCCSLPLCAWICHAWRLVEYSKGAELNKAVTQHITWRPRCLSRNDSRGTAAETPPLPPHLMWPGTLPKKFICTGKWGIKKQLWVDSSPVFTKCVLTIRLDSCCKRKMLAKHQDLNAS